MSTPEGRNYCMSVSASVAFASCGRAVKARRAASAADAPGFGWLGVIVVPEESGRAAWPGLNRWWEPEDRSDDRQGVDGERSPAACDSRAGELFRSFFSHERPFFPGLVQFWDFSGYLNMAVEPRPPTTCSSAEGLIK